jgi:site-specific recombinase XerD
MAEHKRLSEAVEDYERHRRARNIAAGTRKNEMYVLRRFAAWYGDVQVRHMTPEKVARWFYGQGEMRCDHTTRDGRRRDPVAASTHNFYRGSLRSLFVFASRRGWLKADLLEEVDPLRLPTRLRLRPDPEGSSPRTWCTRFGDSSLSG